MLFTVSKDEWNRKKDTGKSLKNALDILRYAKRPLSGSRGPKLEKILYEIEFFFQDCKILNVIQWNIDSIWNTLKMIIAQVYRRYLGICDCAIIRLYDIVSEFRILAQAEAPSKSEKIKSVA